jgi:hypothetical protein
MRLSRLMAESINFTGIFISDRFVKDIRAARSAIVRAASQVIDKEKKSASMSGDGDAGWLYSRTREEHPSITAPTREGVNSLSWDAPIDSKKDTFLYNAQNKFIDLFRVQDAITEAGGEITEATDVRLAEELYHKRSASRTSEFLRKEVQPLMDELGKIDENEARFEKFKQARHAKEANEDLLKRTPNAAELAALQAETLEKRDRLKNIDIVVKYMATERELAVAERDVEIGNADDSLVVVIKNELRDLGKSETVKEYLQEMMDRKEKEDTEAAEKQEDKGTE